MNPDAYAVCLDIARRHSENFPVASRLLPASLRPHVAAIYAFARGADDIADEPGRSADERLRLLDEWAAELHQPPRTAVFVALAETRAMFDLPVELFEDLLSAFRQDVVTSRYDRWDQLYEYCRRSANSVGRLMLRLVGLRDEEADRTADALCTALQLTNFWQDLAIDWGRGRLYVPGDIWTAAGADLADLDRQVMSVAWTSALASAAQATRDQYDRGRPICDLVPGRLRYELRATWLGGVRVLDQLETIGFDVFTRRPTLTTTDALVIGWGVLRWQKAKG